MKILKVHGEQSVFLPHWFDANFYHPVHCEKCNWHAIPGFHDMNEEGPWDFECPRCHYKWSIVMTDEKKTERRNTLMLLSKLDDILQQLEKSSYITIRKNVED